MADSLLIRNSALAATPGGGLVTTAGGAPCCCGNPNPPTCLPGPHNCPCRNPPCSTATHFTMLVHWLGGPSNNFETPINFRQDCCCGPLAGRSYTVWQLHEVYTFVPGAGWGLCGRRTVQGGGSGGQYSITVDNRLFPHCDPNGTVPPTTVTHNGSYAQCAPDQVPAFLVNQANPAGNVFAGGYRYVDCDTLEWQFISTTNQLPPSTTYYVTRGYVRVNRNAFECYTAQCPNIGACCCGGRCFGGVTGSQCFAMGGVYGGHGSSCKDLHCPEPPVIVNPGATVSAGGVEMFGTLPRLRGLL